MALWTNTGSTLELQHRDSYVSWVAAASESRGKEEGEKKSCLKFTVSVYIVSLCVFIMCIYKDSNTL